MRRDGLSLRDIAMQCYPPRYSQGAPVGWEGALFLWAPNVNPFRDPRWGRGQEVPSEEPLAIAEYAAHYIPAMQGIVPDGRGGKFLKTVTTAKHFFDYGACVFACGGMGVRACVRAYVCECVCV